MLLFGVGSASFGPVWFGFVSACGILSVLMEKLAYEQRKLALIEDFNVVFDGVSRENGVSLSEAWVIDDRGSDEERQAARNEDTETRWQDVPEKDIAYGYSCLSFFDEIGFRYYIPAYIVWYLRHMDDEDPKSLIFQSNTPAWITYALSPSGSGEIETYYLSRFEMFTPEESKAIAHFLEFEAEVEAAFQLESNQQVRESMLDDGFSLEEIEEHLRECDESYAKTGLPINRAGHGLERYWGQFLP